MSMNYRAPISGQRELFADVLRIVAILAVISIHVHTHIFLNFKTETAENWWISNILFSASKWAVPVFVMLSGAFILDPGKAYSTRKSLFKRLLKLLIPLIAWIVIGKVMSVFFTPISLNDFDLRETTVAVVKSELFTYHLWFLYMLIGLYLISPILRAYIKLEPENIIFFLLLAFLANCTLMLFLFFDIERVVYNPFYYFTGFIIYFVAGYYLHRRPIAKTIAIAIYALALFSFGISAYMNYFFQTKNLPKWDIFIDNLSPFVIIISLAVFIFFKRTNWAKLIKGSAYRRVQQLSNHSYGIYLVHTIILGFVSPYLKFGPVIKIPFTTIVVFLISLLIVLVIKRIPLLKRIVP